MGEGAGGRSGERDGGGGVGRQTLLSERFLASEASGSQESRSFGSKLDLLSKKRYLQPLSASRGSDGYLHFLNCGL